MALVLNEKYGPGSYFLFISNRVLRLWPTYAVVLVLSLAVAPNWGPIASLDLPGLAFWIASQVFIVGQEIYFFLFISNGALASTLHPGGMSGLLYTYAPIPQAWTLGLEFYFYLLAPLVVRRGPLVIAAAIAGSLILRIVLLGAFGFSGEPWTYRFFPSEIALFLTGSLGYYAYVSRDRRSAQAGVSSAVDRGGVIVRCAGPEQMGRRFATGIVVAALRRDHRRATSVRIDPRYRLGPASGRTVVPALYLSLPVWMDIAA